MLSKPFFQRGSKNRINELKISIFSFRNAPCDSSLFQTCTMPLNRTLSTGTSPLQFAQVRLINPKIISTYVCFYFEKGRKITNPKLIFTTKGIGNNSESVYIRRVVYNAQLHGYRVKMSYHSPPLPPKKYQNNQNNNHWNIKTTKNINKSIKTTKLKTSH